MRWRWIACATITLAACESPAPTTVEQPTSSTPSPAVTAPTPREGPVETALLVVELGSEGSVRIGAVQPKPIRWVDRLVPYDSARHTPRPAARTGGALRAEPSRPAPGIERETTGPLVIVATAPNGARRVVQLELLPPGGGHGDVTDIWAAGGAIWRAPWLGEGTRYEVVRASSSPRLLASWDGR